MKKAMELKAYRESRKDELSKLLNGSSFQGVMRKTVAFLTDDAADHIKLSITTGTDSYTDGKNIVLGLEDYFFDPQFTCLDWVIIYKALLAHELQHINSSNFSDIKDIRKKYTKLMAGRGIPDQLCGKIAQDMLNIMEDGRIENIIVHKLPGYKLPFLMLNSSHLAQCVFDAVADTPGQEFVDFINTSLCYVKTGRLPVGISVYAGTRFETEFKKVQSLFDLAVDARTSNDCKNICLRVLKLTSDYFADLLKQAADQATADKNSSSGDGKNGGQQGEYTSSAETEFNDSPNGTPQEQAEADSAVGDGSASKGRGKPGGKSSKSGKGDEDGEGDRKKAGKGKKSSGKDGKEAGTSSGDGQGDGKNGSSDGNSDGEPKDGSKAKARGNNTGKNALRLPRDPNDRSGTEDWTDNFSGDGAEDYDTRELTDEEIAALRRGVTDELDAAEEDSKPKGEKRDKKMEEIEKMYESEYTRVFSELFPTILNAPLPSELERTGRKLENAFERVLRIKRSEKRNMRVGAVCSRDLYRVGMRDPHIFMRKGQPMKADLAVFLLLDNSGSMGSQGAEMEVDGHYIRLDKSTLSRTAAGVIERGLSKFAAIKISLFDVSGGVIRHSTVKKFDEKGVGSKCYNSIQPVGIGGGNKDGYSIRVATKDLLARRETKKVLVVLSDGLPSDYNGGDKQGMNDVKDAVREARRKGVIVIPIMFGRASDRERMKGNFSYMYGQFISSDPADITNEFQKLFIKLVGNV